MNKSLWQTLQIGDSALIEAATEHVAHGLSKMTGKPFTCSPPTIETVPLGQVAVRAGHPEQETVGIYLQLHAPLRGQALLTLSLPDALHLVDLLVAAPVGTSSYLGLMQRSALAEVGNLVVSYFLNAIAEHTQRADLLRLTPPAVVVDMLATVLNLVSTSIELEEDELDIIETVFSPSQKQVRLRFWVLPA